MTLYLVRHGKARKGGKDHLRPLTQRGIRQTKSAAKFLKRLRPRLVEIWHSDRVRAVKTAELLASALKPAKGMIEQPELGPNDSIRRMMRLIKRGREDLMVVGHLPFLDKLTKRLVNRANAVKFSPSTVAVLKSEDGRWWVKGVIPPTELQQAED